MHRRIRTHDHSLSRRSSTPIHCATTASGANLVKHIQNIAFHKNAGFLEQQAHVKRVARNSYESIASRIRGSVWMFDNGVIRHSMELE